MIGIGEKSGSWRHYQKRLNHRAQGRYYLSRLPVLGLYGGACFLVLVIVIYSGTWILAHFEQKPQRPLEKGEKKGPRSERLTREELSGLISGLDPADLSPPAEGYSLEYGGRRLQVKTSIDPSLQNYIAHLLDRSMTYQAAVVVLRPDNGQVLAMVSYENHGKGARENLCLKADFPAASLFKVVAASAAMEAKGYTPETPLSFRGQKYTLYRSQLKEREKDRWVRKTTLKDAFSGSINPVFGKIGIYDLGKEIITVYAERYLFNRSIPFDLPMGESRIEVPEDDFGLAEIASGFNKRTVISPLHAALMIAAVANEGTIMKPWLVESVQEGSGKVLYQASPSKLATPVTEATAEQMKALMAETVVRGTCRSAFRALRRKKAFREIELGAKTGTINDRDDKFKYDWLVAYALPANGKGGLSLAVLAVHGEKLGIRAKDLARYILNHHFSS